MSDSLPNQSNDQVLRGAEMPRDATTELNTAHFVAERVMGRASTALPVKVMKVTNQPGEVKEIGRVDVKILINQIDGWGNPVEHETIYGLCYFRAVGGKNAVIIDPKKDDIGLAVFADRDMSGVKRTKKEANPGSRRRFDLSDGIYLGGILSETPEQYVRFTDDSIEVKDKHDNKVTLNDTGIRMEDKNGNKIVMKSGGIELN